MKIDAQMNDTTEAELKQKVTEIFEKTEDKNEAAYQAIEAVVNAKYGKLANQIAEDAAKSAADADYKKALNLRTLSKEENSFYNALKNAKQSITADQLSVIPLTIVNKTMADIKAKSNLLDLVTFTPADVKRWVTGSHSGSAKWGSLTNAIDAEISGAISGLNLEANKLYAYIAIPKSIRDLENAFADQYFMAILSDVMQDGMEAGYLNGDGKVGPIGIMRQIGVTDTDGTNKAKTVISTLTGFSPKKLSGVRKTLCNGGKRVVPELDLICNPNDEAEYVDPALFGEKLGGGYEMKSFVAIKKYVTANCPEGTAIITIPGAYTMGLEGIQIDEYKETKALDDVDVIVAKAYGNGRADDDNTAVVFDVTKLVEYIPTYLAKTAA